MSSASKRASLHDVESGATRVQSPKTHVLVHACTYGVRPCSGNLLVRSLVDLVSKDDFVLDSEYLVTLMVVVPKYADAERVHVPAEASDR